MEPDGQLTFGVWTGDTNLATSSQSYNDGAWHHLVAEQSGDGMALFVDGQQVATNPQTQSQPYTGFWRVGGDTTWSGTTWFNGTIDEVAVYPKALSASDIASHYSLGTGGGPVNGKPTAAFTKSASGQDYTFDASTSTDPDGDPLTYTWNYGDGGTDTGVKPAVHHFTTGSHTVTLTVDDGKTGTDTATDTFTVTAVNGKPTAAFTKSASGQDYTFDASTSTDPDGDPLTYTWNYGDGGTDTGVKPAVHHFTTGSHTVTLTVDDGKTGTDTATDTFTVTAVNGKPTAAFSSTSSGLTASFDGSGSTDPDGDPLTYTWNFGDGSTGTGVKPNHPYALANTYHVSLTVDDGKGGSNTVNHDVAVTAPAGATLIGSDDFGRTASNGWGTADKGGAWTPTGSKANYKVVNGVGSMTMTAAGASPTMALTGVSTANSDVQLVASPQAMGTGAGTYTTVFGRVVGTGSYRTTLVYKSNGTLTLGIAKVVGGTTTTLLGAKTISGLTYTAGDQLNIRVQTVGTSPTTIRAKVWKVGTTEPASWQVTTTDATAAMQSAGSVSLSSYLSGTSTNAPAVMTFDAAADLRHQRPVGPHRTAPDRLPSQGLEPCGRGPVSVPRSGGSPARASCGGRLVCRARPARGNGAGGGADDDLRASAPRRLPTRHCDASPAGRRHLGAWRRRAAGCGCCSSSRPPTWSARPGRWAGCHPRRAWPLPARRRAGERRRRAPAGRDPRPPSTRSSPRRTHPSSPRAPG